jgi:hypothetical protein
LPSNDTGSSPPSAAASAAATAVKYAPRRRSSSAGSSRDNTERKVFSLGRRNRIPNWASTSTGAVAAQVQNPA